MLSDPTFKDNDRSKSEVKLPTQEPRSIRGLPSLGYAWLLLVKVQGEAVLKP